MSRIDIMVDLETLGKESKPPVFQIAAATFDIETGEIKNTFNKIADISSFKTIEGATLKWWLNTNALLLKDLTNNGVGTEEELIISFIEWIKHQSLIDVYLWGNGILFDNRIIKEKCQQYNLLYPIQYKNDRDMRTIIELAQLKEGYKTDMEFRNTVKIPDRVEHDAFSDIKQQIAVVSKAYNILIKE